MRIGGGLGEDASGLKDLQAPGGPKLDQFRFVLGVVSKVSLKLFRRAFWNGFWGQDGPKWRLKSKRKSSPRRQNIASDNRCLK